ncbi:hypothetical protein C475_17863 [Halosimplex carlsbadense 2-9-1]|uniref:NHR domain-containing protein n=1 Tax=Halosimplex carlsbadense 2-9-1 TaxID=797114 RepID=M0CID8_9EURY|nr:hypothetical protein [Halosimplex carlsbadense]ELZ22403.1 hypothetical protein C475_17863 [Halosimplex carlsbadense 2-9-1]
MADETLSTEQREATTEANVAEDPTPVCVWEVPDGQVWELVENYPMILDVERTGGGDMPRGARLGLGYREPNDPLGAWTVFAEFTMAPFNTLSLRDQQSGDNAERRRVTFHPERVPGGSISLTDTDEVALLANSGTVIDPDSLFANYPLNVREE